MISLVIIFAGGDGSGGGGNGGGRGERYGGIGDWSFSRLTDTNIIATIAFITGITVFAAMAVFAFRIFLGYPLEVGGRRYFIKSALYQDNRGCFSFAFVGKYYLPIVGTMLLKGIYNFLWYLLLIIPGIVKSYAYSMVPYILADNPNIGTQRAIELSNKMTYGHKFDMFVLDLSFLGWYLLGMLALFIGVFFVKPYEYATKAELYLALKEGAIRNGLCRYDELITSA